MLSIPQIAWNFSLKDGDVRYYWAKAKCSSVIESNLAG